MKKKKVIFLLILVFMLVLSSCKSTDKQKPDTAKSYVENKVELPEGIVEIVDMLLMEDDSLRIVGMDENETKTAVWELKDAEWNELINVNEFLNEKQLEYFEDLVVTVSQTGTILIMTRNDLTSKLYIVDENHDILEEIETEEMLKKHDIRQVTQISENKYVMKNNDDQIYVFNSADKKIELLNVEDEYNRMLKLSGDTIYLLTMESLRVFDTKTMEKKKESEVAEALNKGLKKMQGYAMDFSVKQKNENVITYYSDTRGVIKYVDDQEEVLIDGSRTTFGNQNLILQQILIGTDESVVALMSNDSGESELFWYSPTEKKVKITEELVIYTLEKDENLNQIVNMFLQKYPNVNIKIEVGLSNEQATLTDTLKILNTEIVAGKGPDVIVMDGMKIENYINNELLLDISSSLEKIEKKEGLLENITNAYVKEKECYAVPTRFTAMYLAAKNKELIQNVSDAPDLVERISNASKDNANCPIFGQWSYQQIMSGIYQIHLGNKGEIGEEELTEFFSMAKQMHGLVDLKEVEKNPKKQLSEIRTVPIGYGDYGSVAGEQIQMTLDYLSNTWSLKIMDELKKAKYIQYDYLGENGDYFYVPSTVLGINAKSNNLDISKEFIEFAISSSVQSQSYGNGFPVNKVGFKKALSTLIEENYTTEVDDDHGEGSTGKQVQIPLSKPTKEEIEETLIKFEKFKIPLSTDSYVRKIVMEEADMLNAGKIDVSSATKNSIRKIELYLIE